MIPIRIMVVVTTMMTLTMMTVLMTIFMMILTMLMTIMMMMMTVLMTIMMMMKTMLMTIMMMMMTVLMTKYGLVVGYSVVGYSYICIKLATGSKKHRVHCTFCTVFQAVKCTANCTLFFTLCTVVFYRL